MESHAIVAADISGSNALVSEPIPRESISLASAEDNASLALGSLLLPSLLVVSLVAIALGLRSKWKCRKKRTRSSYY